MKKPGWKDRILCGDCHKVLRALPDKCAHLAITSPPYNVGLEYDDHNDRMLDDEYLAWLQPVWQELHRVLVDGGRFALNIAPTSIKDFKPIHYDMAAQLRAVGFIMRTEIIWYKQTMRRRTAWGSWKSPRNPHIIPSWEYVLVFSKGSWTLEGNKQDADITGDEFINFSDGFWQITPETRGRQPFLRSLYPPKSGRERPGTKAGSHPAPFPEDLIYRPHEVLQFSRQRRARSIWRDRNRGGRRQEDRPTFHPRRRFEEVLPDRGGAFRASDSRIHRLTCATGISAGV